MMRIFKVQGKGHISAEPDLVTLSFGVDMQEEDYGECLAGLNARVEDLRESLTAAGLDRAELRTSNFNVQAETEYNRKTGHHVFVGYRASHNLHIKLPMEKELLNQVLRQVAQGNSGSEIDLTFSVRDKEALRKRVLAQAVQTARENAETLAAAAGVTLGKLQQIDYGWAEVRVYDQQVNMLCESAAPGPGSYDADIDPEEVMAEDNVTLVYEMVG